MKKDKTAASTALTKCNDDAFRIWKAQKHPYTLSKNKLTWLAAIEGEEEVARYLIGQGYGHTAINRAVREEKKEVAFLLIRAGANVNTVDLSENAPLDYVTSRHNGNYDIAKALHEAGARWTPQMKNKARNHGMTDIIALFNDQEQKWPDSAPADILDHEASQHGQWEVINQDDHQIAIKTTTLPQSRTSIKHIFDFQARQMFTQIHNDNERTPPSQSVTSFDHIDADFLAQARQKMNKTPDRPPPASPAMT